MGPREVTALVRGGGQGWKGTRRHVTSMERCPKYKLSEGREEGQSGRKRNKEEGRGGAWRGRPSHHPTDEGLHHEGVLEVADGVAVLGPSLVDPWEGRENLSEDCVLAGAGWATEATSLGT